MPKQDFTLTNPITNASGMLGYWPDFKRVPGLDALGAFFTNPISLKERKPAADRCAIRYPGGVLLHNGGANPGLRTVLKQSASRWADSTLPIVPHLVVENIFQVNEMIEQVENLPGVLAVSLEFPSDLGDYDIHAWLEQMICETPVLLQVAPHRLAGLAALLQNTELSGLVMAPLRGSLPANGKTRLTHGRLYGPSLFPQMLQLLQRVKKGRLAIVSGGGIFTRPQVDVSLRAGASAVQLDTVLWNGGLE